MSLHVEHLVLHRIVEIKCLQRRQVRLHAGLRGSRRRGARRVISVAHAQNVARAEAQEMRVASRRADADGARAAVEKVAEDEGEAL